VKNLLRRDLFTKTVPRGRQRTWSILPRQYSTTKAAQITAPVLDPVSHTNSCMRSYSPCAAKPACIAVRSEWALHMRTNTSTHSRHATQAGHQAALTDQGARRGTNRQQPGLCTQASCQQMLTDSQGSQGVTSPSSSLHQEQKHTQLMHRRFEGMTHSRGRV